MELDHLFLFVKDEVAAREMMRRAGLRVNYSRTHPGQGTRNLCACLDDMYFELLWLDGSPIAGPSEDIGLGARGRGEGSPIGLAWRGEMDLECIPYAAPFLPADISILVAKISLDKAHPFLFQSPSGVAPIDGDESLVGQRQRPTYARLKEVIIRLPTTNQLPAFMHSFERVHFAIGEPSIEAKLSAPFGSAAHQFVWSLND